MTWSIVTSCLPCIPHGGDSHALSKRQQPQRPSDPLDAAEHDDAVTAPASAFLALPPGTDASASLSGPPPLPHPRQRALTPQEHEPDEDGVVRIEYNPQEQSPFFVRLPKDVRLLVYELALGNDVVHVDVLYAKERLAHCLCSAEGADVERRKKDGKAALPLWQHKCWGMWFGRWEDGEDGKGDWLGSLLRSCRRV